MKLYIDFDGTLFDTDRLFGDFIKVCNSYGITDDRFHEAQQNFFSKNKLFNIGPVIEYLVEKYNIIDSIYSDIDALFNDSYLFEDVLDSLKELIDQGHELYMLTYGNFEFQKRKIDGAKIKNYFKDIIITEFNKSELNFDKANSIIIDNNPKEIFELYKSGYNVVRIRRATDKYSSLNTNISDVTECVDFKQVVDLMKGNVNNG